MEVHLELLLGRRVRDARGRSIGRIEEVRAEWHDGEWVVVEFLVGRYALFERLAASSLARAILRSRGRVGRGCPGRIGWDEIDLSDPADPRLRVPPERLAGRSDEDPQAA
jgi:hypothetical protein